jgi:hypothetical protein
VRRHFRATSLSDLKQHSGLATSRFNGRLEPESAACRAARLESIRNAAGGNHDASGPGPGPGPLAAAQQARDGTRPGTRARLAIAGRPDGGAGRPFCTGPGGPGLANMAASGPSHGGSYPAARDRGTLAVPPSPGVPVTWRRPPT